MSAFATDVGGTTGLDSTPAILPNFDGTPLTAVIAQDLAAAEGDELMVWNYCYDEGGAALHDCVMLSVGWGSDGLDTFVISGEVCDGSACYAGYETKEWMRSSRVASHDREVFSTTVHDVVESNSRHIITGEVVTRRAYRLVGTLEMGAKTVDGGAQSWIDVFDADGLWLDGEVIPYVYDSMAQIGCEREKALANMAVERGEKGICTLLGALGGSIGLVIGGVGTSFTGPGSMAGAGAGMTYGAGLLGGGCFASVGVFTGGHSIRIEERYWDCMEDAAGDDLPSDDPTDPIGGGMRGGGPAGGPTDILNLPTCGNYSVGMVVGYDDHGCEIVQMSNYDCSGVKGDCDPDDCVFDGTDLETGACPGD